MVHVSVIQNLNFSNMKKVLFLMAVLLLCACVSSEVEYFENTAHDEMENSGVNQGYDYPDSDQINNSK